MQRLSNCYCCCKDLKRVNFSTPVRRCVLALLCALGIASAAAQQDALHDASAALEHSDYATAERVLRQRLSTTVDPVAMGLLAVALDGQQKYGEASSYYQRALALTPNSVSLLNNYGNHLLAIGQTTAARATFLKVVALNPAHPNANTQVARLTLDSKAAKAGPEALRYLDRLPVKAQQQPETVLLRMRALYLSDRNAEADSILQSLAPAAQSDSRLSFSGGLALAAAGQYAKAEEWFSQALQLEPANFDVLYNLGLAASHAGHHDRAYNVLQTALQLRPDDVDVLYNLGAIDFGLNRNEAALPWLARAAKLAPDRSDVQHLLAQTTAALGYYPDSALAWDRYVKLAPKDDIGRRERGFTAMLAGRRAEGSADLKWYLARHPGDATALYEIAVAGRSFDADVARQHLDRAIALQPDFTAARYARGVVLLGQNQPESALADFLIAADREPGNSEVLDQLGRTYLALNRGAEAVAVLRKAVELNSNDPRMLWHLSRALTETGQTEEARQVMARFRSLATPDTQRGTPAAGLVEFLALPPEQQYARYRARVEKAVETDPTDATAKLRYLMLLLADEAWPKASAAGSNRAAAVR
jgi:tetratricopeptide (TPR) repeat protein